MCSLGWSSRAEKIGADENASSTNGEWSQSTEFALRHPDACLRLGPTKMDFFLSPRCPVGKPPSPTNGGAQNRAANKQKSERASNQAAQHLYELCFWLQGGNSLVNGFNVRQHKHVSHLGGSSFSWGIPKLYGKPKGKPQSILGWGPLKGHTHTHTHLAGIRTPAKKYLFAWLVENKGNPKKAKKQKGELILGKHTHIHVQPNCPRPMNTSRFFQLPAPSCAVRDFRPESSQTRGNLRWASAF